MANYVGLVIVTYSLCLFLFLWIVCTPVHNCGWTKANSHQHPFSFLHNCPQQSFPWGWSGCSVHLLAKAWYVHILLCKVSSSVVLWLPCSRLWEGHSLCIVLDQYVSIGWICWHYLISQLSSCVINLHKFCLRGVEVVTHPDPYGSCMPMLWHVCQRYSKAIPPNTYYSQSSWNSFLHPLFFPGIRVYFTTWILCYQLISCSHSLVTWFQDLSQLMLFWVCSCPQCADNTSGSSKGSVNSAVCDNTLYIS
jgi:hypothetical protein